MFALLNYADEQGAARAGIKVGETIVDVEKGLAAIGKSLGAADARSTMGVLSAWGTAEGLLEQLAAAAPAGASRPLAGAKLLAPLLYPGGIFCAAANYTDHMREMSGREPPDKTKTRPYCFPKTTVHSIIGPEAPIQLPKISQQVDWEAEIAVVIGKPARNVSVADAMDYVAGYTIMNDLSLRDLGSRTDWNFRVDWFAHKCFEGSAPMGPWIVPAKSIKNPYDLSVKLWVNEELMQDSSSSFMHFDIPEQIAYLSERMTLRPGDVISTGTPSGVGRPRGIFLKPGDDVTITIGGIGTLHNPVVQGE
ncbi:MAG TPA: fumarylacetoacetate hydrolase family protein [Alphaproteobacteria bacterium]|jgi:2-keto-4-pentenoate hydratase/2-oxohepta-3-ene-1,7-dioic acid hydratase in catechol pathway